MRVDLDADSWMTHEAGVVRASPADWAEIVPIVRALPRGRMYGHEVPRDVRMFGSHAYCYSNKRFDPVRDADGAPVVPALVARCLAVARERYSHLEWHGALVNLYVNGTDGVSAHSDDETELNPGAPILSFSFGAPRRFVVIPKPGTVGRHPRLVTVLRDGDLVVMGGEMQRHYKHEVPKATPAEMATEPPGSRLNVTVRSFVPRTGSKRKR